MRFVHLAPASQQRRIERAGLTGAAATVVTGAGATSVVGKAVFAMPVVADFWTTYQWLRELRRVHDERMVAVSFRTPDDEPVLAGRFDEPHAGMTASAAARWVLEHPGGAEVVIPRAVAPRDVIRIRALTQRVGWTEVPEQERRWPCLCPGCVPRGTKGLMRRVRGAVAEATTAARTARTPDEILAALDRLETPLERARGRVEPKALLALARAREARVRCAATRLLRYFKRPQVEPALLERALDRDEDVSAAAVEALCRVIGIRRAALALSAAPERVVLHLLRPVELELDDGAVASALELLARHPGGGVGAGVRRIAGALLAQPDLQESARPRLETLR